ncbi:translocation/assembly module TamB domain-containing protein [Rheinheimera sp.]|uniref:autotransporter assembly complex protein TamB n=1 Tax=Rheinheimera sp. TaxID=1869214 RepID=UPI00307CDDD4
MSRLSLKKALLLLVLVLLLCLLSLSYSTVLLRVMVSVVLPDDQSIQIGELKGSLAEGIQLQRVQVHRPEAQVLIDRLNSRFDWRCLGRFELCVSELRIDGLSVIVPERSSTAEQADSPHPLQLPAVRLDALSLNGFVLRQGEMEIRLHQLQSAVTLRGAEVRVQPTQLQQLQIKLPKCAPQSHTSTAPWWQYQPLQLSPLPLPLHLELGLLELDLLQLSGDTELELKALKLQLDAGPAALSLHQLSFQYQQWQLQGEIQLQNSAPFALQGQFSLQSPEQQLQGQVTGSLQQLELQASASGVQQAKLTARLGLLQNELPLSVQLQATALQWPLQGQADWQLRDSRLSAEGTLAKFALELHSQGQSHQTGQSRLSLQAAFQAPVLSWSSLQFSSDQGAVQSEGQLNLQEQSLSTSLAAQDIRLEPWWPDYPGSLNTRLQLQGSYQAKGWQLELTQLEASGLIRQQPLQLQGALSLAGTTDSIDKFNTPGLELRHGGNALTASGQLTDQWQVLLHLNAPDLAQSLAGSKGQLTGSITVTGPQQHPALQLDLTGEQLRYQRDYRLDQLRLTGSLDSQDWQHQLELQSGSGRLFGEKLNSAQLLLQGNQKKSGAILQLDTDAVQAQLQLQAKAQNPDMWQVQLNQAQLITPVGPWTLVDSATAELDLSAEQLRLSGQCWQSSPAELCLQQSPWLSSRQGTLQLQLQQFELAQLQSWLTDEQQLSGTAALTASAQWKPGQPLQARLELTGSDGRWQQRQVSPITLAWQGWKLQASLRHNQLSGTADIRFTDQAYVTARLQLPDITEQDKRLDAGFSLHQVDLSTLKSLLPDQTEFAALLNGEVQLSGVASHPRLAGQIRLTDIRMHGVHAPMDIDQAQLQLDLRQHNAQLSGQLLSGSGQAQLSGYADWFDFTNYQARLALTGQQLPINLPQGQVTVSPELTVLAQNSSLALQGTVQVPQAHLAIDDLPASAVQVSDDELILNKDLEIRRAAEQSSLKLSSEIRLVLGEHVKLQAFGLKSRLKGQLLFSQRGANQALKGEVNLLDGTFRSYGQDLQIRKGKLMFNGPVDQPYLTIEAIRNPDNTEDSVIAGIRVTGPADAASATIFSQPGKPQANALAYLLTGRDLNTDSAGGNPLTTSLIGIGIANSDGLVSSVGEALGFEQVTLDTKGAGDNSQVTVSGYLSPKLQLKYGVGIFNSLGEFTLRYELMKSLYLEAVRGLDNAVDLLYKFEFD